MLWAYTYKGQEVDLIRGEYTEWKWYWLAKIYEKHPEILWRIQNLLNTLPIKELRWERIILGNSISRLVISLNWEGRSKRWIVTAFDLK